MTSRSKPLRGYNSRRYAESLSAWGTPRELRHCAGWIIEREIPGRSLRDAMGPYPLFGCEDWSALPADLEELRQDGLLSVLLVTDPLADEDVIRQLDGFDVRRPFKTHYLAELSQGPENIASRHHAYYAHRAAKSLEVERVDNPLQHLDEWSDLYQHLINRHAVTDLRTFSKKVFADLLALPEIRLLRALCDGETVGAQVMVLQGDVAHAHLSAFTDSGYATGASYLLDWYALTVFRDEVRYINWGGGKEAADGRIDGLTKYKHGWSTHQRTSWLLGAILDVDAYAATCRARGEDPNSAYFPAYRRGEFG